MLGFLKNTTVNANTWTKSPFNVDVNLGLRYVTVECNHTDTDKILIVMGKEAKLLPLFPLLPNKV